MKSDGDADRLIAEGADYIELVPRSRMGEVRRLVEEKPGSGEWWLDGWPSHWGFETKGSKESGDYTILAMDPPGGPFIDVGSEIISFGGRRLRVVSISDDWTQLIVKTKPV